MNYFEDFKQNIRKAVQQSDSLELVKKLLALEDNVNDFLDSVSDEELEKIGSTKSKRGRKAKQQ